MRTSTKELRHPTNAKKEQCTPSAAGTQDGKCICRTFCAVTVIINRTAPCLFNSESSYAKHDTFVGTDREKKVSGPYTMRCCSLLTTLCSRCRVLLQAYAACTPYACHGEMAALVQRWVQVRASLHQRSHFRRALLRLIQCEMAIFDNLYFLVGYWRQLDQRQRLECTAFLQRFERFVAAAKTRKDVRWRE